jgi:hypothetical protein
MTENDYLKVTNRTRVSIALKILRDVMPGENYGISDEECSEIIKKLTDIEDRLFALCKINEYDVK